MGKRDIHTPSILQYEKDWKPLGVGTIWLRGSRSEFYGSVPYDALWGLAAMMAASRYKYVLLHGPTLKRGKSATQSLSFERDINLDDY